MNNMFYDCLKLANLNLGSLDTSSVTGMNGMFSYCTSLTSLNLKNFNTSNVTDMSQIFFGCSDLTDLNLESFDTSSVTSMAHMFLGCSKLTTTITIRGNVTDYIGMFSGAATEEGAKITVNYTSETSTLVDDMITKKTSNSNVVKGTLKG